MEINNIMPFAFMEGQSSKDKSQNIIKVIGVGGGGSNAVLDMYYGERKQKVQEVVVEEKQELPIEEEVKIEVEEAPKPCCQKPKFLDRFLKKLGEVVDVLD